MLGVDEPRFSRYTRGAEQIPRPHLARLVQELDPGAFEYVLHLKDCEDLADALRRSVAEFAAHVRAARADRPLLTKREWRRAVRAAAESPLAVRLSEALLTGTRAVLAQQAIGSPEGLAGAWCHHLADAVRAVGLVRRPVEAAYTEPLLPPEAVPGFRFPINHFVGLLLELDGLVPAADADAPVALHFRQRVVGRLRDTVWAREPATQPMDVLARQFTTHLLSRHGEVEDREQIREFLRRGARTADPLLRRLSFTGLLLGHRDAETADRFLWSLQQDRAFSAVNLLFNEFHYGDLALRADRPVPQGATRFDRSVPHIIRHLEHPEDYPSILETECVTLAHVLERAGPPPFRRPQVLARLRKLLSADDAALARVRPAVRRLFVRAFRPLVENR